MKACVVENDDVIIELKRARTHQHKRAVAVVGMLATNFGRNTADSTVGHASQEGRGTPCWKVLSG